MYHAEHITDWLNGVLLENTWDETTHAVIVTIHAKQGDVETARSLEGVGSLKVGMPHSETQKALTEFREYRETTTRTAGAEHYRCESGDHSKRFPGIQSAMLWRKCSSCWHRAKRLLKLKLKYTEEPKIFWGFLFCFGGGRLFSDTIFFNQDQKLNQINDAWLCVDHFGAPSPSYAFQVSCFYADVMNHE